MQVDGIDIRHHHLLDLAFPEIGLARPVGTPPNRFPRASYIALRRCKPMEDASADKAIQAGKAFTGRVQIQGRFRPVRSLRCDEWGFRTSRSVPSKCFEEYDLRIIRLWI